ncbi:MAG TPA: DUF3303 family protein [Acidobacteriota bacterium]|nr:DUF3303 family protein [Acidobacteriota bacterium]
MRFMMTYAVPSDAWETAVERFLDSGGLPPEGVTMVDRWHAAAGRHGFILLETDDPTAIYQFAVEWSDVVDHTITPVLDDDEVAAVLSARAED